MEERSAWHGIPVNRLVLGGVLLLITVACFVVSVWIASSRNTTALENTLLQFLGIFAGAGFSWVIGDASGRANAEARMQARASSAFRRVVRLYEAQGRVVEQAGRQYEQLKLRAEDGLVDVRFVEQALNTIAVQVSEQIGTSNDAMEDWRDPAPNDVKELERRAQENRE